MAELAHSHPGLDPGSQEAKKDPNICVQDDSILLRVT